MGASDVWNLIVGGLGAHVARPPAPASLSQQILPGVPLVESPLFSSMVGDMGLTEVERDIAVQLHTHGFAVFDFPDADIDSRIERIKADLAPAFDLEAWRAHGCAANVGLRVQDAWKTNEDVRAIAANAAVIDLLSKLYGRRAFPFQTLNFPVGTQQHYHSDSIHFSSAPERFMCGVWLALEDIDPDAGPLVYYLGSHKWPVLTNDMIGKIAGDERGGLAQEPYEAAWRALAESSGVAPQYFTPKKGQALIWAANLLHGGSRQANPSLTRWSQVSHYYFEDCVYYTPAFSDPLIGNLNVRHITDIATGEPVPNTYVGRRFHGGLRHRAWLRRWHARRARAGQAVRPALPGDFDPAVYLTLNPDVAASGMDPSEHYHLHGVQEGRQWRRVQV